MASKTIAKQRQVKVKKDFPQKLFYEKILIDWKDSINDRNFNHTIRQALNNLRKYPLEVNGYSELKKIKGIGDLIATRLDSSWNLICSRMLKVPDLHDIRNLKKGDCMEFLRDAPVSKGRPDKIPFLPRNQNPKNKDAVATSSTKTLSQPSTSLVRTNSANPDIRQPTHDDFDFHNLNTSFSQPLPSLQSDKEINIIGQPSTSFPLINVQRNSSPTRNNMESQSFETTEPPIYVDYDPVQYGNCEILLIVDAREGIARGRAKSICENLAKLSVQYEERPLSVGDFLWVLKFDDGREMVMDYVIERKTWDDLKHSIYETRYAEQKQRLKDCGVRNIVLLVEGGNAPDRGLEQALATTSIDNRFLIQRTQNNQGTAKFLASISERFKIRAFTEQMVGLSFTAFQKESLKTATMSVKDLWIRQLTVIPRMSISSAKLIAKRFPSFRSLYNLYQQQLANGSPIEQIISNEIKEIPKSLSQQMSSFFANI